MNADRIKILEKYIVKEPNDPFNLYALAMEYYDEYPMKSQALLDTLLANHSTYLPSYFKAANLYWELDQLVEAKKIFEKGIQLAEKIEDQKALHELKASYQNLLFEED